MGEIGFCSPDVQEIATLDHRQPDRVCVDFGATMCSGIAASTLHRFRHAVLGDDGHRVRVNEPFPMLGEIDEPLRQALGIDVVGLMPRRTMFGYENRDWRPFTLLNATEVEVLAGFLVTEADSGDLLIHPEGDRSAPPSGRMSRGGYYFDAIVRQQPLDESRLDPADNLQEFAPLSDEQVARDTPRRAVGCSVVLLLEDEGKLIEETAYHEPTGRIMPRARRRNTVNPRIWYRRKPF